MTFDDSKIQLPIHCRLYRQEERAAARSEGVKAMDFVLPYTECNVLKLHHILVYGGSREKSGFGAFHPARMLNITSKLPRLVHVRLPSVFLSPCQGWVSFTLSALFTD